MARRKRHDSPASPPEYVGHDQVANADPDRHYVFVNPNDPYCGLQHYEGLGYEVVESTPDGVRALRGQVRDGKVTTLNQVLMSGPLAQKEAGDRRAWALADQFDARVRQDGGLEGSRGEAGVFRVSAGVEMER